MSRFSSTSLIAGISGVLLLAVWGTVAPAQERSRPELQEKALLLGIRHSTSPAGSRVVLEWSREIRFFSLLSAPAAGQPQRLLLHPVGEMAVKPGVLPAAFRDEALTHIALEQKEGKPALALALAPGFKDYKVSYLRDPYRVVIDLGRSVPTPAPGEKAAPSPPPLAREAPPAAAGSPPPQPPKKESSASGGWTVVLDPGHGGEETGGVGPGGLKEKDLALDLTQRLQKALVKRGYRVVLTRTGDYAVASRDRAAIAATHRPRLFLSLHAGGGMLPRPRGVEVFFLDRGRSDGLRTAPDPRASGLGEGPTLRWDRQQERFQEDSRKIAEGLQQALDHITGQPPRRARPAPLVVLAGVPAPAILVEVGSLSSPEEEKQLTAPAYRDRLAEALAQGLDTARKELPGE
ncbi:MAG: N-acetylmuramoyl-L-alanine amidase [Nitrospirae bacterium]|nr:N-acetylmuramoyl-L-alanine amidase [Nitrospirota bacterium]